MSARIVPNGRPDISEEARDVRAHAWRYVFGCYTQKKGGGTNTGSEGEKEVKNVPANSIIYT